MTEQQTVAEVYEKVMKIAGGGRVYSAPITKNKGGVGHFLEDILGIPHTSNCLDCSDGELKTVPMKRLKSGEIVPKETISVTMLSREELLETDFESSKCLKKMSRMLVVPYLRDGDNVRFLRPTIVDRSLDEYSELYNILKQDYTNIRNTFVETGKFKTDMGWFLQSRTKGAGHGTTSRAFYLRVDFVKMYIPLLVNA